MIDFCSAKSGDFAQRSIKGIVDVELVQIPIVDVLNPNSIMKYNSYD